MKIINACGATRVERIEDRLSSFLSSPAVPFQIWLEFLTASMYFWSVSWSTNCPVYFSFFLVDQYFFWLIKVPSMWFWSVSWSTNCPVFFSFFWSTKKKLASLREFLVDQISFWCTKIFFGRPNFFLVYQKFPETDQKFPETGQFFLVDQKK